jgi:hypothetical protein
MFCCVAVVSIGSLQWVDNNLNEFADDRFHSKHVVQLQWRINQVYLNVYTTHRDATVQN